MIYARNPDLSTRKPGVLGRAFACDEAVGEAHAQAARVTAGVDAPAVGAGREEAGDGAVGFVQDLCVGIDFGPAVREGDAWHGSDGVIGGRVERDEAAGFGHRQGLPIARSAGRGVFGHRGLECVEGDVPAVGQCVAEFMQGGGFEDFAACFADVGDAVIIWGGPLGERGLVVADVLVKDEDGGGIALLHEGVAGDFVAQIFVVESLAVEVDQHRVFAEVGFDSEKVVQANSRGRRGQEVAVEAVEWADGLRACGERALKAAPGVLQHAAHDHVIGLHAKIPRPQVGVALKAAGR